ncbi:MAG: hypothetical protein ACKPER_28210 [Dolichospermum sp.]|uniref:hypothetical protein n=1 Tax=Sphaerospermopsis sp. FACHB-1094 TaxID=2692861 RepID=UPI0016871A79|nr:hypothetical protein [Sphaerospermopsis sp. FACHB-1094]MBD2135193.1 hypothetical protein [Sphaerospermopsis sp. FACHB-1094]
MAKKNLRFIPILGLSIILFSCATQNNQPTPPEATPTSTPTPGETQSSINYPTSTPTPGETNKSRRQYECSENAVEPSISGAIYQDGYCFIPVSTGKCIAIQNQYTRIYSPHQGGWQKCDDQDVVTIPTTGQKYYRFSGGSVETIFVLD